MRFDIPESELEWRFDTSGGPGGQHANRSNTRVELRFSIANSSVFDDDMRERLVGRLGPTVRMLEGGTRSQVTNRRRALRRLKALLDEAARPAAPTRRRTKPSRSVRQRRLERKRRRGELKRSRRSPQADE